MSFLAWAFGLGALAIGFPLLFHLIRRTPRGRQEFSSLMFLEPSPPRLTRRSRLDNWFLLLLRALVILFLAFAFMRPFLRENAALTSTEMPGRRVAILLDTSASMRVGNQWNQAKKEVEQALRKLDPADDIALITFDQNVRTVVDFESEEAVVPAEKQKLLLAELSKLEPSWQATDLATALSTTAESLDAKNQAGKDSFALQIILVSDLQNGADVDSLQSFQWPDSVRVDVRQVKTSKTNNANVRILPNSEESDQPNTVRVRVANAANSKQEQFDVRWANQEKASDGTTPFYVPAGTSRVLQLEREMGQGFDRLLLEGDESDFDNAYFTVAVEKQSVPVIYFGDEESDDADAMMYFLRNALTDDAFREINLVQVKSNDTLDTQRLNALNADLVFVTRPIDTETTNWLKSHLDREGTMFSVFHDGKQRESLEPFFGKLKTDDSKSESGDRERFSLLAQIDFSHLLFAPFANPRYNDFTKIHFWQHIRVDRSSDVFSDEQSKIIASFDDDSPALIQSQVGRGKAYLMTASWSPNQSEFALSTKFVPIVNLLLESANRRPNVVETGTVGSPISLLGFSDEKPKSVLRPDQRAEPVGKDQTSYRNTDIPGIYYLQTDSDSIPVAINLASSESDTAEMPLERLKMHQVLIGKQASKRERLQQLQLLKDKELENRQKIWKWLVVAALAFLLVETFFAALAARRSDRSLQNLSADSGASGVATT